MYAARLLRVEPILTPDGNEKLPGVIIGNGDRKPWDPWGPMIWDNFSIFRTNCTTLTSYIRAASRACRGFSRVCCHVA